MGIRKSACEKYSIIICYIYFNNRSYNVMTIHIFIHNTYVTYSVYLHIK